MNFHDVTFYITIGAATINAAITASKIVKIKEEEPLYKIYKEIFCQIFFKDIDIDSFWFQMQESGHRARDCLLSGIFHFN